MRAARLLAYLQKCGVRFQVLGDRLKFNAPKGIITPDIREELSQYKQELISLIKTAPKDPASDPSLHQAPGTYERPLLSFAQDRLWFFEQLEQKSSVYNVPVAVHIKGQLNIIALKKALNEIIRRHAVLRTSCETVDGKPFQTVLKEAKVNMRLKDLQEVPRSERFSIAKNIATEEAHRPFNLSLVPLLRTCLIRMAEEEYLFLLVTHHFAVDGWSMGILCEELSILYDGYSHGSSSSLPDLSIQYAEAARWQRQQLTGDRLEKTLRFWQQQLDNVPSVLKLPLDRPRPAIQTYVGKTMNFLIPRALSKRLKELSRHYGVTLFMSLMATLHVLLHRYSDQNNIVVATAVSNRNRLDFEGIIGSFMNTVIIHTDVSNDPSFIELLQQVKETTVAAFAHQDLPFEELLKEMKFERNLSFNPLFQVLFTLHRYTQQQELFLPGLSQERVDIEMGTSMIDLNLSIVDCENGLNAALIYNTDLFDEITIKQMAGHYQKLLEGIVTNPALRLSELPLLTDAERHQLLEEWTETKSEYPRDKCIHELFEEQVEKTPNSVAVIFDERRLTYGELNSRANQLAHYLRQRGVGPEELVGICFERSLEMIIGLLGILKAGGAYVFLDPAYPEERLKWILKDANVTVLLTLDRLSSGLSFQNNRPVCLDTDWEEIAQESNENLANVSDSSNAAYVIHTSGSTGNPKGVIVEHNSLVNYVLAAISQYDLQSSDRILQFASVSFDASAEEIYPCLVNGATLVLRTDEMLNSVRDFLHKCGEWKLTVLSLPTVYWHELIRGLATENLKMPATIRLMIIGGEKASPERLMLWKQLVDTQVRLLNTYGPTETTVVATMYDLTQVVLHSGQRIPIGRPISNIQTYILDPSLQPVPVGVSGELHIGGDCLARGYLNRPELTAEKFISNPFSKKAGARLYKTGDLARYLSDGNIEFLGRIDHQVKIRGFRIELGEIEAVISQSPAVREAVVTAGEDRSGDKRLAAYVVLNQGPTITTNELRSFLKKKLPDYMIPSEMIILEALPLTPNGKVDRKALLAHESVRPDQEDFFVAPRNSIEELLANIWCEILGTRRVGIHDNFFELGGHSLLATQVISHVQLAFGIDLPLRFFFESPTVEGLSESIIQIAGERQKLEKSAALLLKISHLSEDEVNTMLNERV